MTNQAIINMFLNFDSFHTLGFFATIPGEIHSEYEVILPKGWTVAESESEQLLITTEHGERILARDIGTDIAKGTTPVPFVVVHNTGKPRKVHLKSRMTKF